MYLLNALHNHWLASGLKIQILNVEVKDGYEIIDGYKRPLTAFMDYEYHSCGRRFGYHGLYAIFRYGFDTGIRFDFSMDDIAHRETRIGGFSVRYPEYFIENSLHWVLDVSLGEDQCQIHHQNGAENWAMLRQLSLNMLRAESSKGSISAKRKRAWMKPTFLEAVLKPGFSEMCKN
jgi:hypothetical protein